MLRIALNPVADGPHGDHAITSTSEGQSGRDPVLHDPGTSLDAHHRVLRLHLALLSPTATPLGTTAAGIPLSYISLPSISSCHPAHTSPRCHPAPGQSSPPSAPTLPSPGSRRNPGPPPSWPS